MSKFNIVEHFPNGCHSMYECSFKDFIKVIFKKRYDGWIEFNKGSLWILKKPLRFEWQKRQFFEF